MKTILKASYDAWFNSIHRTGLMYNTCWEDPRIDRKLLQINGESRIAMITSAGCNALDYLLDEPASIDCTDINPWQGALLELKISAIKALEHRDFFKIFGEGSHPDFEEIFHGALKQMMSPEAGKMVHSMIPWLSGKSEQRSFYFHSTAGDVAWGVQRYLRLLKPRAHRNAQAILDAADLSEQRSLYDELEPALWNTFSRWVVRQPYVLSKLGVPHAQRALIIRDFPNGVNGYIEQRLRHVFTELPLHDNYFWRLYLTGKYTAECCPNYLKVENFPRLKPLVERIRIHTLYFSELLELCAQKQQVFNQFILLDHQDWLYENTPRELDREWRSMIKNSDVGARVLLRSAGLETHPAATPEKNRYLSERATDGSHLIPHYAHTHFDVSSEQKLHELDRVGTYGCTTLGVRVR